MGLALCRISLGHSRRNIGTSCILHVYPSYTENSTKSVIYSKGDDRQVQLAIIAQKSVLLDYESVGRDAQVYSKELYLWGQEQQSEDIKDGEFLFGIERIDAI